MKNRGHADKANTQKVSSAQSGAYLYSNNSISQTEQNVQEAATENQQIAKDNNVPGADNNVGSKLPESVGAMKSSAKNMSHLVNEYGEMKPGENPARFVSVPVSTDGEDRVSLTARTLMEAPETTEEVQKLLEEGVVEGLFSHDITTDKGALKTALDDIKADGFESVYKEFKRKIRNDIILTKDDMAKVAIMYATANKAGDTKAALDIATDIIARGTTMAQGLQAFRLFKKAAPVDKLWAVDKMVKGIENDIKKKDKNFKGIKVDNNLKDIYAYATTVAKEDVFNIKQTDTNSNRRKLLNAGVSSMDVFGRGNEIDSNGNGNKAKAEVMAFIDKQPGLTKIQKAYMFDVYYTGTSANPYI